MPGLNEITVGRIVIEAPVLSFRYPHFLVGRQPSYDMPPPSTIYGHIASAMGELPDRNSVRFAYHFSSSSRGIDLEHQHIVWRGTPDKLSKEESQKFKRWRADNSPALAAAVQPTLHDFLFGCRLVLYIDPAPLAEAFDEPIFCANFGRSQDLVKIERVETVTLKRANGAYLERTLLPFREMRQRTGYGTTALMPRYIGPPPERQPEFETYIILRETIFAGETDPSLIARDSHKRLITSHDNTDETWFVDPDSPVIAGVNRAVIFHGFVAH
jgi:CRISPR-associated protein Cas5t